ncbi:MAG TPA: hypothetical protein VEJ84_04785, partial [Acidimicrobiales bacterium]|nr:hypothetical protein [Acidimicrobiales bacterium]
MTNTRRRAVALGAIFTAVLVPAATALAASPSSTKNDVTSLAAAESNVLSVLRGYRDTSSWRAQFETAVAAQASALAKVSADLSGSTGGSKGSTGVTKSFSNENGVPYTVTLLSFIDPAKPASQSDEPGPGTRLVAALFRITDTGKGAVLVDDANDNASVVGSNNRTYQSAVKSVAGCTNFNDGHYQLNSGQSTTGCVSFEV